MSIAGVVRSKRTNDATGQVTSYIDYDTNGTTQIHSRATDYDHDNRVTRETLAQGVITHSRQQVQGQSQVIHTIFSYTWWDQAKHSDIKGIHNRFTSDGYPSRRRLWHFLQILRKIADKPPSTR